jgi:competence ComEA-like helix-hairpin-helix protein
MVDINSADSIAWESLPGIGVKLAARIVKFREALGGFNSIDQLREVYGIDDSLFTKIGPALQFSSGIFRKVRINYWETDSLDMHPYIQKHEARAIVKYRSQHGLFHDADELGKINLLSQEWIERLKPYITLE